MAHTTEAANLVWQRVGYALRDANPGAQNAFLQLKAYLAQSRSNPQLKFTPIDAVNNGSDGGNVVTIASDTANKYLVGMYLKKSTGSTVAFNTISDHATAAQAAKAIILYATTAGQIDMAIFPRGLLFATGICFSTVTAYNGTTQSLAVDGSNGFVITADLV